LKTTNVIPIENPIIVYFIKWFVKTLVSETIYSGELEVEADEDTREGLRFLDHQDRVKESASGTDGGRRYKEQLDKIHCVISN